MTNNDIKTLIMLEIIEPIEDSEYTLPEYIRDTIHQRYKEQESWEYVFEPIEDVELRNKYIDLFNKLDDPDSL